MTLEAILSRCVRDKDCLIWTKGFQRSGKRGQALYPHATIKGKTRRLNRVVLELSKGIVLTKEQHALHTCDSTKCLNPEHLFVGTHKENMQDKILKSRDHNKIKTHCKHGHAFAGDNLIIRKDGARSCRTCMRVYWNAFDAKNREARRVKALNRYYSRKEVQHDNSKSS